MNYEPVIGLEVHLQLATESKIFCGCSTKFGAPANTQTCPVCLGFPGTLPVLNRQALEYAIKTALALNCKISEFTKFDRKNYFYPDLPKGFQISQYDMPLAKNGYLNIGAKKIGITRVHLEEDAGKLIHDQFKDSSLVDFNRTGMPLLEIVSEPDIFSPDEAYAYLGTLKSTLRYIDVSDCDMEKGSLRCDANISLRPVGEKKLGVKVELKNMNSFKGVKAALGYEVRRLGGILENGGRIVQETRLYDVQKEVTVGMRSKEDAHDYRYFPEPDLVPFTITEKEVLGIKATLPEFPLEKKARFMADYKLSDYDAGALTQEKSTAEYFEDCLTFYNAPKPFANWILSGISFELNERNVEIDQLGLPAERLASMVQMVDDGLISGRIAKEVLSEMIDKGLDADEIVQKKGLAQVSDADELEKVVDKVLTENKKTVTDFHKGKSNAVSFLIGQVMKKTKGKANPKIVNKLLKERLSNNS